MFTNQLLGTIHHPKENTTRKKSLFENLKALNEKFPIEVSGKNAV
jgi:hypothetical protein